jgi:hypothetical protein
VEAEIPLRRCDETVLLDLMHAFFCEGLISNILADLDDGVEPFICDVKSSIVLAAVLLIESSQKCVVLYLTVFLFVYDRVRPKLLPRCNFPFGVS